MACDAHPVQLFVSQLGFRYCGYEHYADQDRADTAGSSLRVDIASQAIRGCSFCSRSRSDALLSLWRKRPGSSAFICVSRSGFPSIFQTSPRSCMLQTWLVTGQLQRTVLRQSGTVPHVRSPQQGGHVPRYCMNSESPGIIRCVWSSPVASTTGKVVSTIGTARPGLRARELTFWGSHVSCLCLFEACS